MLVPLKENIAPFLESSAAVSWRETRISRDNGEIRAISTETHTPHQGITRVDHTKTT